MPGRNPYIENSEKWKALSSIDYYTQFVKAWISFNAWYKNSYPGLERDRKIIEEIKSNNNTFRDKILALLEGGGNEELQFKALIADLHHTLERKYLYQKNGNRITFTDIIIEANPNVSKRMTYRYNTYECERNLTNWKEIKTEVNHRNGKQIYYNKQSNGYNFNEIENDLAYQALTPEVQRCIRDCYKEVNPNKPVSLLNSSTEGDPNIGKYHFISDCEIITKGIITVLYLLRNALFHGEIVPDAETQKIYKPAYQILRTIVKSL